MDTTTHTTSTTDMSSLIIAWLFTIPGAVLHFISDQDVLASIMLQVQAQEVITAGFSFERVLTYACLIAGFVASVYTILEKRARLQKLNKEDKESE